MFKFFGNLDHVTAVQRLVPDPKTIPVNCNENIRHIANTGMS